MLCHVQGLRLHDNHALDKALKDAKTVYPIFCLDPWFIDNNTIGANRINFLLESLTDLDNSLKEKGSRLIVLHGKPLELIPAVAKAWKADGLYFEKDTEPYAIERDGKMMAEMKKHKIEVRASALAAGAYMHLAHCLCRRCVMATVYLLRFLNCA